LAYEESVKQYQEVVDNYPESEWANRRMLLATQGVRQGKSGLRGVNREIPRKSVSCKGEGIILKS